VVKVVVTVVSFLTVSVWTGETGPAGDRGFLCAAITRRD
jgi:hypothetical protein